MNNLPHESVMNLDSLLHFASAKHIQPICFPPLNEYSNRIPQSKMNDFSTEVGGLIVPFGGGTYSWIAWVTDAGIIFEFEE